MSILMIVAFFLITIIINRKNFGVKNFEDYATSSGSFGTFAVALAIFATWYTGAVYVIWADFTVVYGFIGTYVLVYTSIMLVFMYLASEKTYLWGRKYGIKTQAELMDLRYRSKWLRLIMGLTGIAFIAPWLLLEWVAQGYVFYYATGGAVEPVWGMILGAIVVLIYVTTGGMRSVITANLLQGSYMFFIGTALMFYLIYLFFDSFGGAMNTIQTVSPEALTYPGPGLEVPNTYWASIILSSGMGALLFPFVFNKILVADSIRSVKKSTLIAPILSIIFWAAFVFLGQALHTIDFARENPLDSYMWLAKEAGPLPLALMSTLVVAASVSTVAGIIQAIASCVSTDVAEVFNRKITDRQSLKVARISVVVISLITLYFATGNQEQLVYLGLLCYQGILVLFPAVMLGLFWKRANKQGALTSIIIGVPISMYLTITQPSWMVESGWTGGMYAMVVCSAIMIIFGFLKPADAHVEKLWKDIEDAKARSKAKKEIPETSIKQSYTG